MPTNVQPRELLAGGMPRRRFLARTTAATGLLAMPWLRLTAAEPAAGAALSEQQKIEAALPTKAFTAPRKARKLLIFDLNVNYGGHASIRTANLAFTLMGQKTGAFATVVSRDPAVFKPESLRQFDAVFFNNTVGNCFEDPALRQSLIEFIYGGGGLMGVHGTSVAFTKWPGAIEAWPEFGVMLGARGANHRANDEHVFIKLDDPGHPVSQMFDKQGFDYRDEFFRFQEAYSRKRARVLLSIDTAKTDMNQGPAYGRLVRADNDYALAWVRQYGRGRAFYCGFAHHPSVFWDPKQLRFYLAAAQFALGDLEAPTTPSGRLTPAIAAQERLGWRLGLSSRYSPGTLFDLIGRAAELGLLYVESHDGQIVSNDIPKKFNDELTNDELRAIRLKLDAAGVRLPLYHFASGPGHWSTDGGRRLFVFARKMGIETVEALGPVPLDAFEKLCDEFDIRLALHFADASGGPAAHLRRTLQACQGRSKRLGVGGEFGRWMSDGLLPVDAVQLLKERLLTVELTDLKEPRDVGSTVPLGTGAGKIGEALAAVQRLGLKPTMFSLAHWEPDVDVRPRLVESIRFFNQASLELDKAIKP
jgi:type 1 glutamine amidotransferase